MEWKEVAEGLFAFGWSFIFVYMAKSIRDATISIATLNTNVAVVVEQVTGHDRRIEKLEDREYDSKNN